MTSGSELSLGWLTVFPGAFSYPTVWEVINILASLFDPRSQMPPRNSDEREFTMLDLGPCTGSDEEGL